MDLPLTARAIHRFTAESPDELSVAEGEAVTLLASVNDEWWMVWLRHDSLTHAAL